MTLMNRVFGGLAETALREQDLRVAGLKSRKFCDVLDCLSDSFYVKRTGRGRLLASMPGRLAARSAIDLIAIGRDTEDAHSFLLDSLQQLQSLTHYQKAKLALAPPKHESTVDLVEQ